MSQKYIKTQNKIKNSPAFGKYFTTAVYDNSFISTKELATFIQSQPLVQK